ncbi:hypothetical protein BJX76DRAFT_305261 [Aspergillus varians]
MYNSLLSQSAKIGLGLGLINCFTQCRKSWRWNALVSRQRRFGVVEGSWNNNNRKFQPRLARKYFPRAEIGAFLHLSPAFYWTALEQGLHSSTSTKHKARGCSTKIFSPHLCVIPSFGLLHSPCLMNKTRQIKDRAGADARPKTANGVDPERAAVCPASGWIKPGRGRQASQQRSSRLNKTSQ